MVLNTTDIVVTKAQKAKRGIFKIVAIQTNAHCKKMSSLE